MKSTNPSSRTWSWAWQLRATQAFETITPALLSHKRSIPCTGLRMMVGLCTPPGWEAHSLPLSSYFSSHSARICLLNLLPSAWALPSGTRRNICTLQPFIHSISTYDQLSMWPGGFEKREDSQFFQLLPRRLK